MTMPQKNLIFIVVILAVFGFFWAISGDRAHQMPPDDDHIGEVDTAICKSCHIPEGETVVSEAHPPKFECLKCHKIKRVKAE